MASVMNQPQPYAAWQDEGWRALMVQNVANLTHISSENQTALQQLLVKTGQMMTRQEVEEVLDKRVVGRQEYEANHNALKHRVEELEEQPNITRTWLMIALTGGGCGVTLLGIFTSVLMGLLLFGLEHLIK